MFATFYREVDVKDVPGWEYRVPEELFQAPTTSKENECYCPDLDLDVCSYDGGLLLSSCQSGLLLGIGKNESSLRRERKRFISSTLEKYANSTKQIHNTNFRNKSQKHKACLGQLILLNKRRPTFCLL